MSLAQDRFDHEDSAICPARRKEEAEKLAKLGALRERFLLEASVFAHGIAALDKSFIDRWELATNRDSMGQAEAIEGFIQKITENVADLIDHDAVEASQRISELGSDDQ
jgi:hypothetical protein